MIEQEKPPHAHWFIVLTFIFALALDILPLPHWIVWFRPQWTLLVLIYWAMALPRVINVGSAFVLGVLLDLLNGTMLGEHAFAMVVVIYFVVKLHKRYRMYPLVQQTLIIFLLLLLYALTLFVLQSILDNKPETWMYWTGTFTSAVLWPWFFMLMRDWRRRLQVN